MSESVQKGAIQSRMVLFRREPRLKLRQEVADSGHKSRRTLRMTLFAFALAWLCIAFAFWFALQLLKQNGRILTRLDSVERALVELSQAHRSVPASGAGSSTSVVGSRLSRDGLAPGTQAPDFRLPRVGGGEGSIADFRGRPVLLVFSDPTCGPCYALAPALERRSRADDVQVVMVSRGDAHANEQKVHEHGLSFPVGLQRHWEISRLYAMFATPIGYLVDEHGVIAAPVAKGADPVLALLSQAAARARHVDRRSDGADARAAS